MFFIISIPHEARCKEEKEIERETKYERVKNVINDVVNNIGKKVKKM